MTLEFATLAAGVVVLWRCRLPFMVMPIAVTLCYMSMDEANALMQREGFDWKFTRDVSLLFGLATCAGGGVGGCAQPAGAARFVAAGLRVLAVTVWRHHVLVRFEPARFQFGAEQVFVCAD